MPAIDKVSASSAGAKAAAGEKKLTAKEKKPRAPKGAAAGNERKPKASTKSSAPSHPPYFEMIKEAIVALKEKTGSSPYAIAKYMDEKHKGLLPANYKKMLAIQLKNSAAKGKLVKVKASFKLSEAAKKDDVKKPAKEKKPAAAPPVAKKAEMKKKPLVEKKTSAGTKRKASAVAPAAAAKKKKPAATVAAKSPKKVMKKAAPVKPKQPKSIKSPAARRSKRITT